MREAETQHRSNFKSELILGSGLAQGVEDA